MKNHVVEMTNFPVVFLHILLHTKINDLVKKIIKNRSELKPIVNDEQ